MAASRITGVGGTMSARPTRHANRLRRPTKYQLVLMSMRSSFREQVAVGPAYKLKCASSQAVLGLDPCRGNYDGRTHDRRAGTPSGRGSLCVALLRESRTTSIAGTHSKSPAIRPDCT